MKVDLSKSSTAELLTEMSALLLKYGSAPQGELLLRYAKYLDPVDPARVREDAQGLLGMYGGWGGLIDLVLADEHGPNIADNERFEALRKEVYRRMKKFAG